MKSYYYSKKLSATETQQTFELPRLRSVTVVNSGDYNIQIEFEGDVTSDSLVLLVGQSIPINGDMLDIRYKAVPYGETPATSTVYVAGLLHAKA